MNEQEFTNVLVERLASYVAPYMIASKKSVLYSLSLDDNGNLQKGLDVLGEPKRGGGTGFEQDILVYESVSSAYTTLIPRVIAEVKFSRVNTHDPLVYSEKARRIRTVYPYARYGMILGNMSSIPRRVLRFGQGFDFIIALPQTAPSDIRALGELFCQEIDTSKELAELLRGDTKAVKFSRPISVVRS